MIDWTVGVLDEPDGKGHDGILLYEDGSGERSFRACRKRIIDAVMQSESEEQLVSVVLRGKEKDVGVEAIVYRSTGKVHCTVRNFGIVEFNFHLENLQELWGLLKFDFMGDEE